MKKDIILPEWFKYLKKDAMVSVKDFAKMAGLTVNTVHNYVGSGRLPNYDSKVQCNSTASVTGQCRKGFWRKDTILTFLQNHQYNIRWE